MPEPAPSALMALVDEVVAVVMKDSKKKSNKE
jgi:hypothetical protein